MAPGICRAFTMACICRGAARNLPSCLLDLSESSFSLMLCVSQLSFLLDVHKAVWPLNRHQIMSAAWFSAQIAGAAGVGEGTVLHVCVCI